MTVREYKPFYVSDEKWERVFSDTGKSLNDLYEAVNAHLDYEIEFGEDRVKLVNKLINNNHWIYDLLSTEKIINNHVKNKNDFLTEDTTLGKIIDTIVSFLVHCKYINKEDQENKISKKGVIHTKRRTQKINDSEIAVSSNSMVIDKEEKKGYSVSSEKQIIEDRDIKDFPEIKQMQDTINTIRKVLGYGIKMTKDSREQFNLELEKKYGKRKFQTIRDMHSQLQSDIITTKEKLRGTIYFKRLDKTTTYYNFNNDTGYFNDSDYIHISQNKIELKDKKHIAGLIKFYSDLKEKYKEDFTSDMWAILWSLDELIKQTDLDERERFVLRAHFSNLSTEEIISAYIHEFKEEISINQVSRMLNNYIPSKLQKEYLNQYDEWLYTYKVKGRYKKCNSCGEIKLISNDRYFNKEPKGKDGFKTICKICSTIFEKK